MNRNYTKFLAKNQKISVSNQLKNQKKEIILQEKEDIEKAIEASKLSYQEEKSILIDKIPENSNNNFFKNLINKVSSFFTEDETEKLINGEVFEKSFNDNITDIDDLDTMVKASIESLGGSLILPNEGNGNCLYHTFATHLNIDYKILKQDAILYIYSNWDRFNEFALDPNTLEPFNSKDEYKNYMSAEGVWGDHLVILALCELYQINAILVVTEGSKLSDPIKINVGSHKTVLVRFNSEFHYEAIV